jgi:hypothetical protein
VLGLALAAILLVLGGRTRLVDGVLETSGGWLGTWLASTAAGCPWRAITLGHVVLGTDEMALEAARRHEQVHVRQYEQWGPFFLPAYVASSAWQLVCGRRCYRDNWFERQAFDRS